MCSVFPNKNLRSFSLSSFFAGLRRSRGRRRSRDGFILISVLLLGVIFISCATAFAWFTRLQIKSALREKISLENRSMARVLTGAIISGLKSNTLTNYDSPRLAWFKPFLFPADNLGLWAVQITPLDDRIPVRNLFLPDGNTLRNELRKTWEDLWVKLGKREMIYATLDFLDRDKKPRMGGAEKDHYINRQVLDLSEFLLIETMTPALLYGEGSGKERKPGLADYCTLWSGGKINLNVAPREVLAILPGLDDSMAQKIVDYREETSLKGTSDLRNVPGLPPKSVTALMNLADFKSRYFSIQIELLEETGGGTNFNVVIDKTAGKVVRWEEI
ncbi:MAG: general secretion pathway protein GspK [Synergistaceae bacterium]|jgi:type II secretory pathway component PulK|nr:general secretion pathway protein GspK [Synergistaceae bacterium]